MLDVALFSAKSYVEVSFNRSNKRFGFDMHFNDFPLTKKTAKMAHGCKVVCAVNDDLSAPVLNELSLQGVELIAMRCAGFDQVDLEQLEPRYSSSQITCILS